MPLTFKFRFDIDKASNACLYILKKLGTTDFHKLFKILYFADQSHLAKYGRPISGDCYIAMKNGPVPSNLYDLLKALRPDSLVRSVITTNYFEVTNNFYVKPVVEPDMELLSETEIEELDESISEHRFLNFSYLSEKSHATAWKSAGVDNEMDFLAIANDAGATPELLEYIKLNMENQQIQLV